LLRPRQAAQVAVDDDPVETVVYKEQRPTKKLHEQFHGNLIPLRPGERREPQNDQVLIRETMGGGQALSPRPGDQASKASLNVTTQSSLASMWLCTFGVYRLKFFHNDRQFPDRSAIKWIVQIRCKTDQAHYAALVERHRPVFFC
jgi:hypothetical protein